MTPPKAKRVRGKAASPTTIAVRRKQEAAVKLRTQGKGFQQIADELGFANPGNAYRAVQAVLARAESESADELRRVHSERLALAYQEVLPILQADLLLPDPKKLYPDMTESDKQDFLDVVGDAVASQSELRLKAADRLVRLLERESKLHGLDAPARTDVTSGGETTQVVFHSALSPNPT